jgi:L-asparaginase II
VSALVPVATLRRGGFAESHHFAAAAVATPDGRLVARLGEPSFATIVRSAAKPLQALPLVEAGGVERFGLDDADLALICASHGGRPEHVERARSLLARGGFTVDDLQCGAHPPLDAEAARALAAAGEAPTPLHNNCSGKHAGMLLACRLLDLPAADYLDPEHPLQRRIRERVALFCGVAEEAIGVAVDGCSAPTFHLPLAAVARAYAALVAPGMAPPVAAAGGGPAAAAERLVSAMTGRPEMVAGPGRFTTLLMQATRGRILGKEGAEAFYAAGVRGPVALGVALKIADGGERGRDGVVIDLLRQLGVLSAEEMEALAGLRRRVVRNHRGLEVGEVVPDFELEDA